MKKIHIILIIISILFIGCSKSYEHNNAAENTTAVSQSDKINENIEKRYRDLETVWDNLRLNYRYNNERYPMDITREELEMCKQELKNKIPYMKSDVEFYCELQNLVAKLKDGHTKLTFKDTEIIGETVYRIPIEIGKIDNSWILTGVYKNYQEYLGYELLAINDMPIEEVYNNFLDYMSYENKYWADYIFPDDVIITNVLEYLNIINDCESDIKLLIKNYYDEEPIEVNFDAIKSKDYVMEKFVYVIPKEELRKKYYNSYELNKDAYLVELNKCRIHEKYDINEFKDKVITDIKENKYRKIIIDLRFNTGGIPNTFEDLIDELKKLQISDRFDVYILIGNTTYSAAVYTAVYINSNLRCTFYGSPTGGKPDTYGAVTSKDLETPFVLSYTYIYLKFISYDDMMAFYPDITVVQTYEDYINKVDTVLEAVLLRK